MQTEIDKHITNLIKQKENQQLDFKYEINDSKKIAKTISAFANTFGGTLLIGVKDNGNIVGVCSEEEYHMVVAAAQMYCKPKIVFDAKEWHIDGKTILEIIVPKSKSPPVKALLEDNKWIAYIRVKDQNISANRVMLKVWKKKLQKIPIQIKYTETEKTLLNYLKVNNNITLKKYTQIAKISYHVAEKILADFILLNIIEPNLSEKNSSYKIK